MGGAFGAPQQPTGGAFGAPQQSMGGAFGAPQQMGGMYGAPQQMGGFATGAPSGGAGRSIGIIALVIGVIGVSTCGIGFAQYRRAQDRRLRAIRDLNESLANARSSYNYGSNSYGSNSYGTSRYGSNSYGSTNSYGTTPTPSYGTVPSTATFISNTGNRSLSEISPVFLSRIAAYQSCVANDPSARGSMGVRFMIGSNGRVLTAFASPGTGSSTADTCITGIVRTLNFRPSSGFTILIHPLTVR
jgi:hypothetical protein